MVIWATITRRWKTASRCSTVWPARSARACTLQPALQQALLRYDRLALSLGLQGWSRWRYLEWPLLRQAVGRALALAGIFSLGDLGAVAMFGSADLQTLPWLLFQQLGSYRLDEAAATALLLLLLCVSLLGLVERGLGGRQ